MTTTKISMYDLHKALRVNFMAGISVEVRGASGAGKSDSAEQYAQAQGPDYGFWELNAATANLMDVLGVLMPHKEMHTDISGEAKEITAGRYSYPYFMRDKFSGRPSFTYSRGMFLIEEYGQATPDLKRGLGTLIWAARNGEHVFPKGVDILILSNRPEDRSGVTKDFDFLINRRNILECRAEFEGWSLWAHDNEISNMSMAYAKRNEGKVFSNKAPEKQGPWLTPRSLVTADKFLKAAHEVEKISLDDDFIRVNLSGIIGEGYAHEYLAFAKLRDQLPSFSSIVTDPRGAVVPSTPDQQMFIAFELAHKAERDNIKPIITYMKRLPKDFSVAFFKSAVQRDKTLRSTREFGDWAVENKSLLAAVNAR